MYTLPATNEYKFTVVSRIMLLTSNNVRLYIGLIQQRPARLADRRAWGYTITWEGRSRLNVRWGAVRPLSIECHPPAQVTRFGTLGTGFDQCPSSLASL